MTELGRGIDELEVDLLQGGSGSRRSQRLSQDGDSLLGTGGATLEHDEGVLDETVVGEATHRVDGLLGDVVGGGTRLIRSTLRDSVDLLVDLSSVMVTVLTRSGNGEHDLGRMPSTDTGDLSQTLVGLSGQLLGSPSVGDTFETVTLGNTNDINALVLLEDGGDIDSLFKVVLGELDLVGNGTTVDLDLHQVCLLLLQTGLSELGVCQDSNDGAVLPDSLEFSTDGGTVGVGVLLGVLGEGLLLGLVPVLVESSLDFVGQVFSPDGGQGSKTSGGLDVTDNTNDDHGRGLDDGNGLDDFSLVHLGSGSVKVSDDMGHTSLVAHESGKMNRLGRIILGESLYSSSVPGGTLSGQETQGTVSGSFVLSVRHLDFHEDA